MKKGGRVVPLDEAEEVVLVNGIEVFRFCDFKNYTDSFGYEWKNYPRTYSDETLGLALSKSRLELNLGFPLEFLRGMNVLEIGCGAGRFTEQFVKYAKSVVAVDASEAIYVNSAIGAVNATFIQADLMEIPPLSEEIDLVFCRGVLQHTESPHLSLQKLFSYARDGGLVIFDVYKKHPWDWRSFKYFWRPFFGKYVSLQRFNIFITQHVKFLYKLHHFLLRLFGYLGPFKRLLVATPLYLSMNWERQYPQVSVENRYEIFKNEMIDMLYAHYDQPMYPEEVINTTALIGQIPYSYDVDRNHFRYKKTAMERPMKVRITKNGVFEVGSRHS